MTTRDMQFGIRITADGKVAVTELARVGDAAGQVGTRAKTTAREVETFGYSLKELRSNALAAAAGFIGPTALAGAVTAFGAAVFRAGVDAERTRRVLEQVTGSAAAAAREMDFVRQISNRLGLELTGTADAYAKLAAAARGTALEGGAARQVFTAVSQATAALGLSAGDTQGVLLALQQMISKGTVSAEELRGQLGERLPGAFQLAARAMGVSTAELGKMLEQGQIATDDFLPRFARELEKTYGSGGPVETAQASLTRLTNAWTELKQSLADEGGGTVIGKQFVDQLTDALGGATEAIKRIGKGWGNIILEGLTLPLRSLLPNIESAVREMTADPEAARTTNAGNFRRSEAAANSAPAPWRPSDAYAKFVGNEAYQSKSEKLDAARLKAVQDFAAAVRGADQNSAEFAAALAVLNQGLANIAAQASKGRKSIDDTADAFGHAKHQASLLEADLRAVEKVRRELDKREQAAIDLAAEGVRAVIAERDAMREALEQDRERLDAIGLEGPALAELSAGRLEAAAARIEEKIAAVEAFGAEQDMIDVYREQIAILRDRAAVARQSSAASVAVESAKQARSEWQRTADGIADSLTDALLRGFESGKDFAANLRDTLVNMFKTLVLRPIIQPIAQSAAGAVLGAIGLGAPGSAAAAGGNLFSLGSSALNFSGLAGGAIGSVLSGLGGFGAGIAEALMGSSFVGPTSAALGVSGAGLGGMLGAAMPWIGGALALASILGAFGKGGGPKSGGETHYLVNASGTRDLGEAAILGNYTPADANAQMSGVGAQLAQQIRDTVLALGGSISKDLLVYLGYDTDPQGTAGNRVTSALAVNGQQIYRVQDRGVADVAAGVGEESKRLLVAALQATDISPEIDAIFDRVGNISTAAVSALDGALAEAQRIVDARIAAIAAGVQAVADAYQRERDAKLRAAAEWRQLAGSVAGTLSALGLGQLSALSPEQQLAAAQGAYGSLATRARLGDQSAIAGIGSAAQDYLTAARAYFASGGEYASIFAEVTGTLSQVEGVATRRADILDQQAALMTEQVAGIRLLAEQGATLNQAVDALAAEQAAGNRANEAGITALITELRALNTRMAALETAAALAQAA